MHKSAGTRFWVLAGVMVLVNFLLIGLVLLRGDQTDVLPVSFSPADGAAGVSTQPIVRVVYRRPMDAAWLRATFRIDPPVQGEPQVNGGELTFIPARPLQPGSTYTVVLPAGIREVSGKASRREVRFSFQTRAPRLVVLRRDARAENAWGVDPATGSIWRITDEADGVSPIAPSPDGDELAYIVPESPQRSTLWAVKLDGGQKRAIARNEEGLVLSVAWSPRGDLLAYERRQIFGSVGLVASPKLWLARPDGTPMGLLYGRGEETGSLPVWAPDGRQLAFFENRHNTIAIFNFTKTLLTIPSKGGGPGSWSPDGQAMVYTDLAGDGVRTVLKVARLEGGSRPGQPIVEGRGTRADIAPSDSEPAWSPAGGWIAFVRRTETGQGIWLIRPEGGEARPLHRSEGWTYTAPFWAPDGSAVAFSRFPTAGTAGQEPEIWVAPLAGQPRQLGVTGLIAAWVP